MYKAIRNNTIYNVNVWVENLWLVYFSKMFNVVLQNIVSSGQAGLGARTSKVCFRPGVHPALDVGKAANSLGQILDLGALVQAALVRQVAAEVEEVKIRPAEAVPNQELSSATLQPLLDVAKSGWDGLGCVLLHLSLVLGEESSGASVHHVVDSVDDLVDLGGLHVAFAGQPDLPGDEPGHGHGLGNTGPVPLQQRKAAVRSLRLQFRPLLGVLECRGQSAVLVLDAAVGQQEARRLGSTTEVEVSQLHFRGHCGSA